MNVSILVPIYNEKDSIVALRDGLFAVLERMDIAFEIVVVNDGSSDGSADLLDAIAAADPRFKVLHFKRNFGQTAALMAAIDHAKGDVLIPMDGDLQNDPADIPRLLDRIREGYDVVSGWRKDRKDNTLSRTIPSKAANWLISRISGVHLHDYGCSLKAYRRTILENVRLYGEMHRFVPIYAAWEGARIAELVVKHHPRRFGTSKYGLTRVNKVVLDLILLRFMQKTFDRPIHFFGTLGTASLGLAAVAGLWSVALKIFADTSFISTPLLLFAMFFGLSGVLFVLLGLIAELQMRVYFESQSKRSYAIRAARNLDDPAAAVKNDRSATPSP
jgi:glycosyltransferase involved in cell wall biosynthesis